MPKNVGVLVKLIVAKGLKNCPKFNKSPNLVTLRVRETVLAVTTQKSEEKLSSSSSKFFNPVRSSCREATVS